MNRIIACDLDGTLLNSSKQISTITANALQHEVKDGACIIPATGRTLSGVPDEVLHLSGCTYLIAMNGAEVYALPKKKLLYKSYIPREIALQVYDVATNFSSIRIEVFYNGYGLVTQQYYHELLTAFENTSLKSYFESSRKSVPQPRKTILQSEGLPEIAMFTDDINQMLTVRAKLQKICGIHCIQSACNYMEIISSFADKSFALKYIAEQNNCTPQNIIAFGDGENDIAMLSYVGHGVAMGNGSDKVKAASSAVTADNDHDGIAVYLNAFNSSNLLYSFY